MTKTEIRSSAIGGLPLHALEVARMSRDRRSLTLRHAWEGEDGRAVDAVMMSVRRAARALASARGHDVEVYDRAGHMLDVISPE